MFYSTWAGYKKPFGSMDTALMPRCAVITPERITEGVPDFDERLPQHLEEKGWIVIVYDNDFNTWDEVTMILQKATGCNLEEAEIETWEVDNLGKSVVHHSSQEECERAAGIIRIIGIRVEVVEE